VWPDNETDRDFVNFEGVADTVAEIIAQAEGRPISIGVTGAWGVGKSSMIRLTRLALDKRQPSEGPQKYVFVDFNAWLYQGYDDARAALLEVIAAKLEAVAEERQTGVEKAKDFFSRVRWLRLAKLIALPAAAIALGLPPIGLAGELSDLAKDMTSDGVDEDELQRLKETASLGGVAAKALLTPKHAPSPPKMIQDLRNSFEETLAAIGVTLVVLIDDLDRCLPDTTISTLEAIRLFLFLQNTAFVIAADDDMIKHAVRKHFGQLQSDELVTNYFDKLIQIPIRVPSLGTQEVRAYIMMLFVEDSTEISSPRKDAIKTGIASQLRQSWKGQRVDRAFVKNLDGNIPPALMARLETAERLAPLMTTAKRIAGNPRLIKRFLNALSIRMTISSAQGVGVDEAVLAKLLLFERLAPPSAYFELTSAVNADTDGKPSLLAPWEQASLAGQPIELPAAWDDEFVREWIGLPPALAETDLRGALYVGREQAPLLTPADRLSSEGAVVLTALLESPAEASALTQDLERLPRPEVAVILERLLAKARQEQSWGAPSILTACMAVVSVDPSQGSTLAGFLMQRPISQITPSVVPKIADTPWAADVLKHWLKTPGLSGPAKIAIQRGERGNIAEQ
jgi:predicted KAP-like P-loop ATPase